jgi:hypothetical protein
VTARARKRGFAWAALGLAAWTACLAVTAYRPAAHRIAGDAPRTAPAVVSTDPADRPAPARRSGAASDTANPSAAGPASVHDPRVLALARRWLRALLAREGRSATTVSALHAYRAGGRVAVDFTIRRAAGLQLGQLTIAVGRHGRAVRDLELGALLARSQASH